MNLMSVSEAMAIIPLLEFLVVMYKTLRLPCNLRLHRRALYEALEKVKLELMLLGFMSLLPTVGQRLIPTICISNNVGAIWHPCIKFEEEKITTIEESDTESNNRQKLLSISGFGWKQLTRFGYSWRRHREASC